MFTKTKLKLSPISFTPKNIEIKSIYGSFVENINHSTFLPGFDLLCSPETTVSMQINTRTLTKKSSFVYFRKILFYNYLSLG